MPYIEKARRPLIDGGQVSPNCAGDLNYLFTKLYRYRSTSEIRQEIRDIIATYILDKGLKYQHINDIVGALVCSLFEHYRVGLKSEVPEHISILEIADIVDHELEYFYMRVAGPYEDTKIEENGDV